MIAQINDISTTIASAVEEQTATANEMSRNVSEAAKGTAEIAQNITAVAQAAQNTTQGATNSQQAAGELRMAAELQRLGRRPRRRCQAGRSLSDCEHAATGRAFGWGSVRRGASLVNVARATKPSEVPFYRS